MICIGRGIVVVAIQFGFRGYFALGSSEIKRNQVESLNTRGPHKTLDLWGEEKSSEGQE